MHELPSYSVEVVEVVDREIGFAAPRAGCDGESCEDGYDGWSEERVGGERAAGGAEEAEIDQRSER